MYVGLIHRNKIFNIIYKYMGPPASTKKSFFITPNSLFPSIFFSPSRTSIKISSHFNKFVFVARKIDKTFLFYRFIYFFYNILNHKMFYILCYFPNFFELINILLHGIVSFISNYTIIFLNVVV